MKIRRATETDAALLAELGERTFVDTFAADNTPENMAAYLPAAFSEEIQRAELRDAAIAILILEIDGQAAGYAKLRRDGEGVIEINRLYADKQWIGRGVGAALMQASLDFAAQEGCSTVWLAVWDMNHRARAFYAKWGFVQTGTKTFTLGDDPQTDLVLERRV
jgi:GNAT superfamily N-acetyltransferase